MRTNEAPARRFIVGAPLAGARGRRQATPLQRRLRGKALHLIAILAGAFFCAAPARAHPIHTSYAEADYRPESGKLEIAVRLFTDDAEAALSGRAGRKISLNSTPAAELDALLQACVRTWFTVKSPDGAMHALAWVGRELTDKEQHVWIYLQCALPGGVEGARFRDRVLRETYSDQLNSIRVRDHSTAPVRQITLLFTDDTEQSVRFR
jgi:hypothetical protein